MDTRKPWLAEVDTAVSTHYHVTTTTHLVLSTATCIVGQNLIELHTCLQADVLVTGKFLFHWLAPTLCKKYQHFQHGDVLGKQHTDLLNVYYYNSDKDMTDAMMLISEKLFT